jgi:phytoene synthase
MLTLPDSYAFCERVARREAGNFYHAFRVLPRQQRLAMCALYAFLRISDDLSDGPDSVEAKRALLVDWRQQFERTLAGEFKHELSPALHDVVQKYQVPHRYLEEAIDGVMMDLDTARYATFADLYRYCYHVASVVGLACIHIWGFSGDEARVHAEKAGVAFQLTNILRDLREDAERGRVYLPREDLDRFGYSEDDLRRGERNAAFRELMRFEVARAREYYDASAALAGFLPPPGRAVFSIMSRTYRGLLDAIERRNYDVFTCRVRVSTWRKVAFAVQALPMRWGLL